MIHNPIYLKKRIEKILFRVLNLVSQEIKFNLVAVGPQLMSV